MKFTPKQFVFKRTSSPHLLPKRAKVEDAVCSVPLTQFSLVTRGPADNSWQCLHAADSTGSEGRLQDTRWQGIQGQLPPTLDDQYLASLTPEEQYLAHKLGRRLTITDSEEYYWEDLTSEESLGTSSFKSRIPFQWCFALAKYPIEELGGLTLRVVDFFNQGSTTAIEKREEEASRPLIKRYRRSGRLSDMMISLVAGVIIASFVVFPFLRLMGREVFITIAKSTVRRIGEKVSLEHVEDSVFLPLISEQMLYPKLNTSGAENTSEKKE